MSGIVLCPIECPNCGNTVFVMDKEGKQDFKCKCGFEDELTLETIK